MSQQRRYTIAEGRSLPTIGAAVLASCLLVLAVGCQDLASDALSTSLTTTTAAETGTTETAETDSADSGSGGHDEPAPGDDDGSTGDPEPDDDDAVGPAEYAGPSLIGTVYAVTTTENRTIRDRWTFDESDNNQHRTVRTRDYITVELDYARYRQVTSTRWNLGGSTTMISNHGYDDTRSLLGDYIVHVTYDFFVNETGDCTLMIVSYHERDREYHTWQVHLTATE